MRRAVASRAVRRCMEACVRVLLGQRPAALGSGSWELGKTGTIGIMNVMQASLVIRNHVVV